MKHVQSFQAFMLNYPKFGQITQIRDWFWLKWAPWWGISPDSYLVSLVWRQGTWRNEDLWESSIAPLAKLWRCKHDKTVICNEVTVTVDFFWKYSSWVKVLRFLLGFRMNFLSLVKCFKGSKTRVLNQNSTQHNPHYPRAPIRKH